MNTDLENAIVKAKNLAHQGSEGDALALAEDLISHFPGKMEVWLLSSYLHARSRQYQKAVSDVTTAIEINRNEPSLFYDRGRYRLALGDDRLAMEDFSVGLSLCDILQNDYYRETLYFHRAEVRLRLGKKLEALEDLAHVRENFSCWTYKLRTKAELIAEGNSP